MLFKKIYFVLLEVVVCLFFVGCGSDHVITLEDIGVMQEQNAEADAADSGADGKSSETGVADLSAGDEEPGTAGEEKTASEKGTETISEAIPAQIYVFVCGEVCNPGVVKLPEGSRAEDALLLAGGFTEAADRNYVNLALQVFDGEKLYIPSREEQLSPLDNLGDSGATASKGSVVSEGVFAAEGVATDAGRININTADESLLMTLPGVGKEKARAIVAYRSEHGAFEKPEDIKLVSGIGESTYEKWKDLITVK